MDVDAEKSSCSPTAGRPSTSRASSRCCASTSTAGRLRFTTSYEEVAAFGDVHFLCVGTPQRKGEYAADLRYVDAVVDGLAPHLTGPASSSASPPCRSAPRPGWPTGSPSWRRPASGVELAWNPEFLREGFAVEDTLRPDRLVVGVRVASAPRQLLREVYATAIAEGTPFLVTDFATAELVKVVGQRLPRHQDLVHQRDGRGVRGDRRRRHRSSPTRSATTSGSAASSSTPASASAAAACPRTSARSWPGPASSASTRR